MCQITDEQPQTQQTRSVYEPSCFDVAIGMMGLALKVVGFSGLPWPPCLPQSTSAGQQATGSPFTTDLYLPQPNGCQQNSWEYFLFCHSAESNTVHWIIDGARWEQELTATGMFCYTVL